MSDAHGNGSGTRTADVGDGADGLRSILLIATIVSVAVNIVQVLTSVQEMTIATVPRLLATAGALLLLMPWMLRKLTQFTLQILSNFRLYLG